VPTLFGRAPFDITTPPGNAGPEGALASFLVEFWEFLRVRKKYWLLPVLIVSLLFGGLIVLTQGSAVAPFIYTLF
jgi:hypothetical protein